MRSQCSPRVRFLALFLACLMALSQTNCVSVQWSPSMAPGGEGGDTTDPTGGGSSRSSTGSIVGIATIAVVGGYLVYRAITGGEAEDENPSAPVLSVDSIAAGPLPAPIPGNPLRSGKDPEPKKARSGAKGAG